MQAVATWRKGHEFLLEDGRAHSVLIDLPPEEGGSSAGTTPLELSALALVGSLASTFAQVARKRHLDFSGLTLVVEGDPPTSSEGGLHGTLRLRTRAERSEVDAALRAALELCPVSRIFREARVPVHVVAAVSSSTRPT
ncbi:MAG: OsmC family protein [Thermoplasmata archaeon]|nr:OsmC family protein [Thermoplasmata archaeon]